MKHIRSAILIGVLMAWAVSLAWADTIRIRTTHEGVGFTNQTTNVILLSNRVERIKEWNAAISTQRLDAAVSDLSERHITAWSAEWKRRQIRDQKQSEADAAANSVQD